MISTTLLLLITALMSEPVETKVSTGNLYGTLDLPLTAGPWPVILIHPGSGPTDRDGNAPGLQCNNLKQLGRKLAGQGYACLRIDKRGIAASAQGMLSEEDLRFTNYVDDVMIWCRWLRKQERFNRLILLGHSEGSLIVTLAAAKVHPDAMISLCGMGRAYPAILRDQLSRNLPDNLKKKALTLVSQLEDGQPLGEVPKSLLPLFRPSVIPYLRSASKYDPAKLLGQLDLPILIVSGTTDIQTSQLDYNRLVHAAPQASAVRIDAMNHVLKSIDSTARIEQVFKTYIVPHSPLHPKLIPVLDQFLQSQLPK